MNLARLAVLGLAGLFSLTALGTAATHPLSSPQGLALASNGNLYVANNGGNNILVYSPAHAQLPAKTITENISSPTAVAFDPNGNLWAANAGTSSITEYNSNGVQNPANTANSDIFSPEAIGFDGLGDLWVNDGYQYLEIFALQPDVAPGAEALIVDFSNNPITSIATWQGYGLLGGNSTAELFQIAPYLLTRQYDGPGELGKTCFGAAFDSAGDVYCANEDGSVTLSLVPGYTTIKTLVANTGFFPYGMALDQKRGLIYISNATGNSIAVYTTSGQLVTTIK